MRTIANLIIPIIAGIATAVILVVNEISFGSAVLLNFTILIFFSFFNIFTHEFGHVLAAKIAGIKIKRVVIGNGKELFRKKIFGVNTVFTSNLHGGYTFPEHIEKENIKHSLAIFVLGGVVFQIIITLLIIFFYGFDPKSFIVSNTVDFSNTFIISNLYTIIFSLVPVNLKYNGINLPNDCMTLIKIPYLDNRGIQEILSVEKYINAYELFEKKEYESAVNAYKELLEIYPNDEIPKINMSTMLIKMVKLDEAKDVLEALLVSQHKSKYDFVIYNNLAWIYLLKNDDTSIKQADKYSALAFKLNPQISYSRGTRGCILIEIGQIDDGIKLLNKNVRFKKLITEDKRGAMEYLFLAYAYFKKQNKFESKMYLDYFNAYLKKLDEDEKYIFNKIMQKEGQFELLFSNDL